MPHALLIHEAPGTGGDWLAAWGAALVLCERGNSAPCGECSGCRRVASLHHPDVSWVRPLEESRQIRIEQVRELSAELALTSHGGGYKVAILTPADALNRFAANALLKTLEEPPARTLLLDLPVAAGLSRARERGGGSADRFEAETVSFFEKVRAGYLDLARQEPARMHLIDATAALSEVQQQVAGILTRLLRA